MEDGNAKGSSSSLQSSNGLRKVFSRPNRSRTTLVEAEGSAHSGRTSRTPSFNDSTEDVSRPATSGGGTRDGPSGISKLIRRKHRNKQEDDTSMADEPGDELELRSSRSGESRMSLPALEINGQRRRSMTEPSGKSPIGTDSESDAYVIFVDTPYYAFHEVHLTNMVN